LIAVPLALLVAGGAVAAVILTRHHHSSPAAAAGHGGRISLSKTSSVAAAPAATGSASSTPTSQTTATGTTGSGSGTGAPLSADDEAALASINGHWKAIANHRFADAYGYLGPALASGQSTWVSNHQGDGITSVSYAFHVVQNDGSAATVAVDQLRTVDVHGCERWSGDYAMTKQNGRWLINGTTIHATPC
jgi:hypothetical protein